MCRLDISDAKGINRELLESTALNTGDENDGNDMMNTMMNIVIVERDEHSNMTILMVIVHVMLACQKSYPRCQI